jgi:hypothetical protein
VLLTSTLQDRDMIRGTESFEVIEQGMAWLAELGIDTTALQRGRRPLARPCLDWSERRHHLAGAAGAAIATRLLELGWIRRLDGTRAVRLTLRGREHLARSLGQEIPAGPSGGPPDAGVGTVSTRARFD